VIETLFGSILGARSGRVLGQHYVYHVGIVAADERVEFLDRAAFAHFGRWPQAPGVEIRFEDRPECQLRSGLHWSSRYRWNRDRLPAPPGFAIITVAPFEPRLFHVDGLRGLDGGASPGDARTETLQYKGRNLGRSNSPEPKGCF